MGKGKLGAALAIAAIAIAVPVASAGGTTGVTIKENSGDFSGKVSGSSLCRSDRLVKVRLVKPGKDQTIASDTSESNGTWNTGNTSADPGDYYAKVKRTDDCEKAKSGTVTVD